MACRGVCFALTREQEDELLACGSDDEALEYVQEHLEAEWDEDWLCELDKSWDAIHRCLTDGTLNSPGRDIRETCILGGRQLHSGSDYIISFITADEVKAVSGSIRDISRDELREKYFGMKKTFLWIDLTGYGPLTEEDFGYTWAYFEELNSFYQKAAEAGRSMIFTVDQ